MKDVIDRRVRARVPLRCPIQLYRSDDPKPVTGETQDLSSAGFYCLVPEEVREGDHLDCILTLPSENITHTDDVNLHCEVEVIRVENRPAKFGVACRIDRYSLVFRPETLH